MTQGDDEQIRGSESGQRGRLRIVDPGFWGAFQASAFILAGLGGLVAPFLLFDYKRDMGLNVVNGLFWAQILLVGILGSLEHLTTFRTGKPIALCISLSIGLTVVLGIAYLASTPPK